MEFMILKKIYLIIALLMLVPFCGCRLTESGVRNIEPSNNELSITVVPWLGDEVKRPFDPSMGIVEVASDALSRSNVELQLALKSISKSFAGQPAAPGQTLTQALSLDADIVELTRGSQSWLIPVAFLLDPRFEQSELSREIELPRSQSRGLCLGSTKILNRNGLLGSTGPQL